MSNDVLKINKLEQFEKFKNDKQIIEICIRDKKKRLKKFQKVMIPSLQNAQEKELAQKAVDLINKNNDISKKTLKLLNEVSKINQLNLILNGLNLCATCAGFAIMYDKLNKISSQINELIDNVKAGQQIQADFKFKETVQEHSNMLDCRKTKKYYSEEKMRELVDGEYTVLDMLIQVFNKGIADDPEALIFSIFSIASMLAISIQFFDAQYYFNNRDAIEGDDKWHTSHHKWVKIYDDLTSDAFIEKLQDHGVFDLNLSSSEADAYYLSLRDHIKELKEQIEDNQILIETIDDRDMYEEFLSYMDNKEIEEIKESFEEAGIPADDPRIAKEFNEALKQVALA